MEENCIKEDVAFQESFLSKASGSELQSLRTAYIIARRDLMLFGPACDIQLPNKWSYKKSNNLYCAEIKGFIFCCEFVWEGTKTFVHFKDLKKKA